MRIQKKTIEQTISSNGSILYRFNINGQVYIGQSFRGFGRLYQHFANSYYYSRGTDVMPVRKTFYMDLRKTSGRDLDVSFITGPDFNLTDKFSPFLCFFRPMTANGLYQYNNVDKSEVYKRDLAELLYIYYESSAAATYNKQCGSQHDIAEIAFQQGKAVPGKRILKVSVSGGTDVTTAANIFENPVSNADKIRIDLTENMSLKGSLVLEDCAKLFYDTIKAGIKSKQSVSSFKKSLEKTINEIADIQLKVFKENIKKTGVFDTCSIPVDKWNITPQITYGNMDSLNKILNLKNFIPELLNNKDIIDDGILLDIKLQYDLDPKVYDAVKKMDSNLLNQGRSPTTFNGIQVDQDFRRKMAVLRFIDIWYHVRSNVGSQLTGSEKIFHTRPARNKFSESEGWHELPQYAFVVNSNPEIREDIVKNEFIQTQTYIPSDGQYYYHILMSIADPSDDLQFIRKIPLAKRQKGVTRTQYSIYIYPKLPAWVSSPLPTDNDLEVHGAYAMSGDDTWIREGLNDTIDLSDLLDY